MLGLQRSIIPLFGNWCWDFEEGVELQSSIALVVYEETQKYRASKRVSSCADFPIPNRSSERASFVEINL